MTSGQISRWAYYPAMAVGMAGALGGLVSLDQQGQGFGLLENLGNYAAILAGLTLQVYSVWLDQHAKRQAIARGEPPREKEMLVRGATTNRDWPK